MSDEYPDDVRFITHHSSLIQRCIHLDTRFIVGIDLGTTNSALARFDAAAPEEEASITVEPVPQLTNPNEVEERTLLPSFLYLPGELDFPKGALALPWEREPQVFAGELARKRGAENPSRLVASAKSWLSYAAVDRASAILPWGAPEEVRKLSPVEASAEYLRHLRHAWDARVNAKKNPELALGAQQVMLTVPAAFYAWVDAQGDAWRKRVKVGDLVLVCDVGGGTTDFSLITVSEEDGALTLKRVAVGEHILLGGDNMDLALARLLQQRLEEEGHRVDTWQLQGLWHQCRLAKEKLFADPKSQKQPVTLLGKGSKLVGGTVKTELRREDLERVLADGFFPLVGRDELPARQRRIGFQELGLPYAADPA